MSYKYNVFTKKLDYYVGTSTTSGVSTFIALTDTPSSFTGSGGYVLAVNGAESAVEYVAPGSTNLDGGRADSTYGGTTAVDGGDATSF